MTIFPDAPAVLRRALALAAAHVGKVEPNPPVGCVLAVPYAGGWRAIGEGAHENYGGPHAEVHALADARRRNPDLVVGSTAFVTLEPCNHTGRTGPCTEALVEAGVARVVAATADPAPHTAGAGFARLRDAGINVEVGVCEDDAKRLIAPFAKLITTGRPWVHAKWAMTLDGKLATRTGHSRWISGEPSRALVHEIRGRMDAVVVGIGTALADDPLLTARPAGPRVATRVVVDSGANLSPESQLATTAEQTPTLLLAAEDADAGQLARLAQRGVEAVRLPATDGRIAVDAILAELGRRKMTHVLVEGGGSLLGAFRDADAIDEVHAFVAPKLVGGTAATTPVAGTGLEQIPELPTLKHTTTRPLGDDIYIHGRLT
ncbi:MAG: bifunctional diaminohydroxyphosphoribosylaminopyrimidine deaminase/5-amino-6-(5-phosphoribosylamino)uracil reductase RibD [Planctomycetota bacterium]